MGWFDRFTSKKGKAESGRPSVRRAAEHQPSADERAKQAFAAVPSGKTGPTAKPADRPTAPAGQIKPVPAGASRVLLSPVVTEKATLIGRNNQYIFSVAPTATKSDVRQAVQHHYRVRPTAVSVIRLPGKAVRYGRTTGRTAARKKAVITLPRGKTIDLTVN